MSELLTRFASVLKTATESEINEDITLGYRLLLGRSQGLTVSYAPFEHIQSTARIVIAGITPGIQQAANALVAARRHLLDGSEIDSALAAAKTFASFSGPMRTNLVAMLDHMGIHRLLGIDSTGSLWSEHRELVHFTSVLRYPVLVDRKNYNGQPSMADTPILRRMINECLCEEAIALPNALWVPLGPKAMQGVKLAIDQGVLKRPLVLEGLPHPSGANAERIAYFLGRKSREALSAKTDPIALDRVRDLLSKQISTLAL